MAQYDAARAEKALADITPIYRGCDGGVGMPLGSRTTSRIPDFTPEYELFRPIKNIPRQQREIIAACMNSYHRIGLLRNVVDMMASFGCQGIQVLHPVKSRERVYRSWWNRVRGAERSERFLNGLFRAGNVIVKKTMGKLTAADMRDLQRSYAGTTMDSEFERLAKFGKNEIPIEYTFLNPTTIETAGGDLATFLGHPVYILKIPNFIVTMIRAPKTPDEAALVDDLPAFIRDPVKAGQKFVKLDNDKLSVYHYMKDDWQQWAMPVTYSILADLILYEKMKLADMAALNGAISHIRIWKLGDLDKEIQVGPAMYQKLHDMLLSNVGGGAMDLIWDAAIDLLETGTDVANFLGATKYEPVLKSIYAGLGLPQSLVGGGQSGASFTNNAISLKTLIERLSYGRNLLTEFWNNELRVLQEAFGDKQPARVLFDNMSLYDEAAEKMLWFQLYDRHLCDDETMQERFGLDSDVVSMRIKREETKRNNGTKPPKATPFHDPQADHELVKIALQQGTMAPTETGVEKKPKQRGDKSILDFQAQQAEEDRKLQEKQQQAQVEMDKQKLKQGDELHKQQLKHNDDKHQLVLKQKDTEHKALLPIKKQAFRQKTQTQNQKKGVPGQGRPKNSQDTTKRKRRTPKPSLKAFEIYMWARDEMKVIAEHTNPLYLAGKEKKTLRALSSSESEELESLKFNALCGTPPMGSFSAVTVNSLPIVDFEEIDNLYRGLVASYVERRGVQPSIDERRDMQVSAYAAYHSHDSGETGV